MSIDIKSIDREAIKMALWKVEKCRKIGFSTTDADRWLIVGMRDEKPAIRILVDRYGQIVIKHLDIFGEVFSESRFFVCSASDVPAAINDDLISDRRCSGLL